MKRDVYYLYVPLFQTPLPPPPTLVKNTHFGGRQHQGHRTGVGDIPTGGGQLSMVTQGI